MNKKHSLSLSMLISLILPMLFSGCGWRVGPMTDIRHIKSNGFDRVMAESSLEAPDEIEKKLMGKLINEFSDMPVLKEVGIQRATSLGAKCYELSVLLMQCDYSQYVIGSRYQRVGVFGNTQEGLWRDDFHFKFSLTTDNGYVTDVRKQSFTFKLFQPVTQ